MWKNFIICASAMAALTGCGNAVGEAGDGTVGDRVEADREYDGPSIVYYGVLPDTTPPVEVRDVEGRVKAQLFGNINTNNFTNPTTKPADHEGGFYLIGRHLEKLSGSKVPGSCKGSNAYSGFAATDKFAWQMNYGESEELGSLSKVFHLIVCETSEGLELSLSPMKSLPLFSWDELDSLHYLSVSLGNGGETRGIVEGDK